MAAYPQHDHPYPVSCPDCNGVLLVEEPSDDPIFFRCQIGHRYTLGSVIRAKEQQLEQTLSSAAVQLVHLQHLYEQAVQNPHPDETNQQGMRRRLTEVITQHRTVLAIIEDSHVAS